jgi:HD-GYP domain-containing protein (c-di-GMP phosphodiesterase class II)
MLQKMDNASIKDERPIYNSRIIDNYIKLIKRKYSHVNVGELLRYSKMTSYAVADEGHWFTQEQINLFHEKLSQVTNNENIAREAGRYAASPDAIGILRPYLLGMVDTATVYGMIGKAAGKFTKSTSYASKKLASNKVEITVTPRTGTREKPFQCQNRLGFLEAVALAFNNKLLQIEHTECVFKGGKICRYIISWEKSFSALWKKIRNYSALSLILACIATSLIYPLTLVTPVLLGSMVIVLILSIISVFMEKRELTASLNYLKDSTDQMLDQIEVNYNNALMTNEIGQALSTHSSMDDILLNIIKISNKRLDYDRCMILLADQDRKRLLFTAGYGYEEDQLRLLKKTSFHLNRPRSKGILIISFREQRPFLVNDINEIKSDLSARSLKFVNRIGSKSFICCPIISDGESIGVLAVDNLKSKRPLVQSDMSLLIGVASVLGISIRNANLLEARDRQFRSILQVLAASIDARDPMTAGHSAKVTEYALGICDELGLSRDYREMIRVAALLHDYGKIGIPDAILKKPGKLTEHEYEFVKNHSFKSRRILEQINFDGVFNQVPEIVGAHHEKFNGDGYPDGLEGEEIPLGARIIAVADFFEAITAKRHYRGPIPLYEAIMLLKNQSGESFDTKIVDAFFNYYLKTHAGEPAYRASMI